MLLLLLEKLASVFWLRTGPIAIKRLNMPVAYAVPLKKMIACAISTNYVKLFKTSYQQNRSKSKVGVY